MVDVTSDRVKEYIWKGQVSSTPWQKYVQEGQKGIQLFYHQKESITLYSLKNFEDTWTRNKFKRSDMDIYMAYASLGVNQESMSIYRNGGLFGQNYVTLVKYLLLFD